MNRPTVAVVGHVEWLVHTRGEMARPGQITYLGEPLEEPAGGGAVTAAQVAKLGVRCLFFTALGDDARGDASARILAEQGVEVLAARPGGPQTWAVSAAAADGERGISVIGPPVVARASDPLPWERLAECDAAFFTGHDADALVRARAARALVVTARRVHLLAESGVAADVLVASADDANERFDPADLPVPPVAIVMTEGSRGGRILAGGRERRYPPVTPPGPVIDSYGAGDSFAAGITVGLALGMDLPAACRLGARCGATALTARGGLPGQLRLSLAEVHEEPAG